MLCWECQKNSENKKSQENKMLDIFRILNNILILKPGSLCVIMHINIFEVHINYPGFDLENQIKFLIWKFLKRWEYQTTLPIFWETCIQVKEQKL